MNIGISPQIAAYALLAANFGSQYYFAGFDAAINYIFEAELEGDQELMQHQFIGVLKDTPYNNLVDNQMIDDFEAGLNQSQQQICYICGRESHFHRQVIHVEESEEDFTEAYTLEKLNLPSDEPTLAKNVSAPV